MMLFGALNFFTFRSLKQKLHTSERLHAIVDYTVDGIITVDKGGHIQTFNPACEAMFGYKEDEVIGKNIKALLPLFQKNVIDLGNTKESLVKRVEIKGVKQSGEKFPVYLGLSKIPHGHKEAFTAVLRDISQQKEIESNLIKAKKSG